MKKTDNNINYLKKLKILERAKKFIRKNGWSKDVLKNLTNDGVSSSDLVYFFPNGYEDLLNLSLQEINKSLEKKVKKINIISFSLSKRIKKILMMRIEILNKDKNFYKKTFNHLLLPHNSKILKKNLYYSVDNMWYFAGDNSTNFSFYTKRFTLSLIYINALFVLFNKSYNEVELNIDKNLKRISRIPKIKDRFSFIKNNIPLFLKGFLN